MNKEEKDLLKEGLNRIIYSHINSTSNPNNTNNPNNTSNPNSTSSPNNTSSSNSTSNQNNTGNPNNTNNTGNTDNYANYKVDLDSVISILEVYFDQIIYFNPLYKLVKADNKEIIIKHFLDSLGPFDYLSNIIFSECTKCNKIRVADYGSGAGFPGLVLSSVFLNIGNANTDNANIGNAINTPITKPSFYLVERMGRRAGFLRTCSVLTGLSEHVSVLERDITEITETFDLITMRAFRPLSEIYADILRTTKKGSKVIMYKSSVRGITDELSSVDLKDFSTRVEPYAVPFLNAERNLLVLTRQ